MSQHLGLQDVYASIEEAKASGQAITQCLENLEIIRMLRGVLRLEVASAGSCSSQTCANIPQDNISQDKSTVRFQAGVHCLGQGKWTGKSFPGLVNDTAF
jgi:hypothetical protein